MQIGASWVKKHGTLHKKTLARTGLDGTSVNSQTTFIRQTTHISTLLRLLMHTYYTRSILGKDSTIAFLKKSRYSISRSCRKTDVSLTQSSPFFLMWYASRISYALAMLHLRRTLTSFNSGMRSLPLLHHGESTVPAI